jgi:8-oxo-dGTP diphosphatase
MTTYTKIGCEAFIVRDDKVLLLKRGNVDGEGTWSLPGGHLDFMERIDDGLIRELKEELNVVISPKDTTLIAVTDDLRPKLNQHYLHMTFRVNIGDQEPECMEPDKCAELRWFPVDAMPEDVFPFHAKIFDTLNAKKLYLSNQI